MSTQSPDLVPDPAQHLKPIDMIAGFPVRPGFFRDFGATVIPGGVSFTIQSHGAVSCELLLFHREAFCVQFRQKHLIERKVVKVLLTNPADVKIELVTAHARGGGGRGVACDGPVLTFGERAWVCRLRKFLWLYEKIHVAPFHGVPEAEGVCLIYQLFPFSGSHGIQLFPEILFLFLLQLLSQTGYRHGYHQGAGCGMKGRSSQLLYDGLVRVCFKAPEGILLELEIISPARGAPETSDFFRQIKAQMGGLAGKGVRETVFLHGSLVQSGGQAVPADIFKGFPYGIQKHFLQTGIPVAQAEL